MPSAAKNSGAVHWTYGDWRRQPTRKAKIARLIRHIEEVETYAFELQDRGQRLSLQQGMLPRLEERLDQLEAAETLEATGAADRIGKTSKFERGGDA